MELEIGNGTVYICNIVREGRKGILLRPVEEAREVGKDAENFMPENEDYIPQVNDVVIWLKNIEGVRVLQDIVGSACLIMDGYRIVNEKSA